MRAGPHSAFRIPHSALVRSGKGRNEVVIERGFIACGQFQILGLTSTIVGRASQQLPNQIIAGGLQLSAVSHHSHLLFL